MGCEPFELPHGTAIVCNRGRRRLAKCSICGKPCSGEYLCDYPTPDRKSGTCDRPLCSSCRVSVRREVDVCPDHPRGSQGGS